VDDHCRSGRGAVRISDVRLLNGSVLQFEVRFGQNAVSRKMPAPPDSGMIQVNLANENTRVVEESANQANALELRKPEIIGDMMKEETAAKETALAEVAELKDEVAELKAQLAAVCRRSLRQMKACRRQNCRNRVNAIDSNNSTCALSCPSLQSTTDRRRLLPHTQRNSHVAPADAMIA
jgi:hypothetical protein